MIHEWIFLPMWLVLVLGLAIGTSTYWLVVMLLFSRIKVWFLVGVTKEKEMKEEEKKTNPISIFSTGMVLLK